MTTIRPYTAERYMLIDSSSRRNLELVETLREKQKRGSLLWVLDKTKTGRIVEALILVVFSFLDYLICFISVAEMDCLKDRRYAAAKESGEFYKVSEIESSLFNYVPRTYTIYYRRGSRRLTFGVRTRTTGNPLEMGGREYFIGPTGKREQIVKDLDALMKEVKKYARFDKVLVQTVNGEPVKR